MNAFNQAINGFNSFTQNVGNNPLVQKLVQFGNQMRGTPVMASSGSQQNQTGWKPAPEGGGYYPVYNEPAPFKYLPDPTPRPVTQPAQMQNNNPIVPITRPIQSPVVSPSPITNPIAGFNLTVPGHNGPVAVPQNIAQQIGHYFEPYGEATSAARLLNHPMQLTNIPGEQRRGVNTTPNRGENPEFITNNIDIKNPNGSIDRGLFRVNSDTFDQMMAQPFWRQAMVNRGITSWEDMNDINKNVQMALLILKHANWNSQTNDMNPNPSYAQWYAAPKNLRNR